MQWVSQGGSIAAAAVPLPPRVAANRFTVAAAAGCRCGCDAACAQEETGTTSVPFTKSELNVSPSRRRR